MSKKHFVQTIMFISTVSVIHGIGISDCNHTETRGLSHITTIVKFVLFAKKQMILADLYNVSMGITGVLLD